MVALIRKMAMYFAVFKRLVRLKTKLSDEELNTIIVSRITSIHAVLWVYDVNLIRCDWLNLGLVLGV